MSDKLVSLYAIDNMLSKLSGMYHIEDIRAMLSRVPAAEINTEPHWISVEDKLPEKGEIVIARLKNVVISCSEIIGAARCGLEDCDLDWEIFNYGWLSKVLLDYRVTHWMPLPNLLEVRDAN